MFEAHGNGKSLDEEVFESWLEKGRNSQLGYFFLLIIWDSFEEAYHPVYTSDRESMSNYRFRLSNSETFIAAYDLYSESRINLEG